MPQDENGFELEESVALDDNGFEIAEAATESVAQPKAAPQIRGGEPSWRPPALVPPLGDIQEAQKEIVRSGATPLFPIPHVSVPARPFGQAPTAVKAATGVVNSLADTASFFTSPLGISTLGMGMLPKAAQRVIAGVFAAHMASQMPEIATALGTELGKPESDRDAEKIANLTTTAATQLGFATLAGKHALSPTPKALRLAEEIGSAELSNVPTPDAAARRALALPPRAAPQALIPELERTRELVDRAIQEATQKIVVPGQTPALDLLRAQGRVIIPESIAAAERIQGGGQAPYGKLSYMRGAEAPTTERTQNARQIASATSLPESEIRPSMGEETPLRQQGEVAEAQPGEGAMGRGGIAPSDASKITSAEKPMGPGTATGAEIPTAQVPTEKPPSSPETTPTMAREQVKEPWQMTKQEWAESVRKKYEQTSAELNAQGFSGDIEPKMDAHANIVRNAIDRGRPVPPEVLSEYPDLTKPTPTTNAKSKSEELVVEPVVQESLTTEPVRAVAEPVNPESKAQGWLAVVTSSHRQTKRLRDSIPAESNLPATSGTSTTLGSKSRVHAVRDTPKNRAIIERLGLKLNKREGKRWSEQYATPTPPTEPTAAGKGALDTAIKNIEDLQKRIRGTGENLGMNVPRALLDTALEVARLTLKAGKTVTEAIEAAIAHIRKNASAKVKQGFDEANIRETLMGELRVSPEKKEAPIRVEGTEEKMRKSAERAVNSDEIPEPVRERISAAPESQYKVQPQEDVNAVLDSMTDAQLAAVPKESNIYVGSRLKLSKRLFDQGKYDEGYDVFQQVSEAGTDFGQNINQFKMLKGVTPFDVVKVVNQGLKKSGRDPLTKPQEQKVAKSANESIEANKQLKKAQDDWLKDPTDANAKLADAAADAAHKADLETQKLVNQYTPKSWPKMLKAFVQGNPLTPISQVANVVGNVLGAGMETGSRGVGSMLDQIRTMFTGGERKLAVSPVDGPKAAASGLAAGAKQGVEVLKRGSGDVVKGEFRQNLRPLRALQTAFAKNPDIPTVKGKVPFNERVRLAVEGTFGVAPEVMLRLLSAADKPSYESARARLINEQTKLKNVPPQYRRMAQKFPELFFDRETLRLIQDESLNAVFQNKSLGISYLESWIKNHGGDWADLAFTMLVAPYRLTPWNLVGRTLIYNPVIAAMRTAYFASKKQTRLAELNAGRMIVGGMLYGAGYFLYKNGLIGPSLDSRDETKKERMLAGEVLPPNHVNVSGLNRLAKGGDPKFQAGDETIDLTRGGGAAGAILSSVANIGRDFEKKPEGSTPFLASLLKNSTLEQASFTINQSFLKGVTGILDAVRDRNLEPYMNSVESMFLNVGTPNTLSTLSRATRKYAPDLKSPSQIESFKNLGRERFGVAGLDDYLPLKRDLWGKPMLQTPEGRNAILYHLFDISKNRQVTSDPVALELYDLWRRTAKREVIPSIPERQITIGNKTHALEPSQYERLVELVGQNRREVMDALIVNPQFQNLDADNKIKVIERAYRQGLAVGKALFVQETPPETLKEANKPKAGFNP